MREGGGTGAAQCDLCRDHKGIPALTTQTDHDRPRAPRPRTRLALGLLLIGTGRKAGFAQFGTSGEAFLGSLAPLVGILLVLCGLLAWAGRPLGAVTLFLCTLCGLLAPVIIADLFCRLWHKRDRWGLHANVLNCSQWLIFFVLVLLMPVASLAVAGGMPEKTAAELLLLALGVYILWFQWFIARHALDLSPGRALLVTVAIVFGTSAVLQIPLYAGVLSGLQADPLLPAEPTTP